MSPLPTLPSPQPQAAAPAATYQAPRLTPLGRWEAVTLIYSVPLGPGTPHQQPPVF